MNKVACESVSKFVIQHTLEARSRLREGITALRLIQDRDVEQPSLQRYKWALRENNQNRSIEKMGNG